MALGLEFQLASVSVLRLPSVDSWVMVALRKGNYRSFRLSCNFHSYHYNRHCHRRDQYSLGYRLELE